jgi:uncharacterized protein HemX
MSLFTAENLLPLFGLTIVVVGLGGWGVFVVLQMLEGRAEQDMEHEDEQESAEEEAEKKRQKMEELQKKMEEKEKSHVRKRGEKVKSFRMQGEYGARKFIKP